jgi:NAD(P)-dependent dehydrogenase (short-subunit alcohol dehydrogenase family)
MLADHHDPLRQHLHAVVPAYMSSDIKHAEYNDPLAAADGGRMTLGLAGARILVTAGASGIGLATVQAFLAEAARVHVCDVDQTALDALAKSRPEVTRSLCDVADAVAVDRLFETVTATLGGLDVLVNNAGIAGPTARCEEVSLADWERTLAVNLTGQFLCAPGDSDAARQPQPSIVNLSSAAGRFGFPMRTPYSASKWAVIGLSRSLSIELGADGIRVNAICPGSVAGARIDAVFANKAKARGVSPEQVRAEALAKTSLGQLIEPEDIAHAIVFLASRAGARISGQALGVDADVQRWCDSRRRAWVAWLKCRLCSALDVRAVVGIDAISRRCLRKAALAR